MSEKLFVYDTVTVNASKVEHYDHPTYGPITVFKNVPIAREIIQEYEDGMAWKPADELEKAYWTADGRWAKVMAHPETTVLSSIDDINGRMVNPRFTKSLKDLETRRPMVRGGLVDLEVFDNKVAPDTLKDMLTGIRTDVSIGFFFDKDGTPGIIEEDGHPLNGSSYDYVQRNLMIDHLAFGLEKGAGRCPFPACGIGADRKVTADPFAGFENWADCIAQMTKPKSEGGQGYTKEQAEKTCGMLKAKYEEEDETLKSSTEAILFMSRVREQLRDILSELNDIGKTEDYPSSEYSMPTSCMCRECGYILMAPKPNVEMEKPCSEYKCPNCGAQMYQRNSPESGEELVKGDKDMTEKDCVYEWEMVRDQILNLKELEPTSLAKLLGDMVFEEDKVTITRDTRVQFAELGMELKECDQEDAGPRSEAERAMAHFNISPEDWAKLSDEEKQEYIRKLPERRGEGEETDEFEEDETSIWVDEWIRENVGEDAVLSYAQKKALPDSAYAYIEAGCKKEDGKTEQKCRHLLIHDKAHVQAALAALGGARTGKVPSYASKAKGKVCAAAKKFKIESEVCGTEKKKDIRTPEEVMRKFDKVLKDADLKKELGLK